MMKKQKYYQNKKKIGNFSYNDLQKIINTLYLPYVIVL